MKTAIGTFLAIVLITGVANAAMPSTPSGVTVRLHAVSGSGENGTATLTQTPKGLEVVINLTGAPAAAQPAHIHPGTCPIPNPAPKYFLKNVVNGKSTTMLAGLKLADVEGGKFTVNVHKSTTDFKDYVSCGEIK